MQVTDTSGVIMYDDTWPAAAMASGAGESGVRKDSHSQMCIRDRSFLKAKGIYEEDGKTLSELSVSYNMLISATVDDLGL